MKKLLIGLIIAAVSGVFIIAVVLVSVVAWFIADEYYRSNIDRWAKDGAPGIHKINHLISSNWSWAVKEEAVFAAGTVRDDSSIPILVEQLYYKGHWWAYWWNYEDSDEVEAFYVDITYALRKYGDRALSFLMRDLERRGPWKASPEIIFAIGNLGTDAAGRELRILQKDPKWGGQRETIEQAIQQCMAEPAQTD